MSAYYNENDPNAAATLRELIRAGLIAPGDVDDRSVEDVRPDELLGYEQCHFFAGFGVWSYAARCAGVPDATAIWTGSCPCQPFSIIGKRKGFADERHLWPAWRNLIRERQPAVVFGEQVSGGGGPEWLDGVCTDLEAAGYAFAALDLSAAGFGAPIRRQRFYWVARASGARLEGFAWNGNEGEEPGRNGTDPSGSTAASGSAGVDSCGVDAMHMLRRLPLHDPRRACGGLRVPADRRVGEQSVFSRFEQLPCADGWRRVEPGTFPMAHGAAERVGRLRGYGNAIVVPVAQAFIEAVMRETA